MKLECEDCGTLEYVEVDGYGVGDRLLEGVIFRFYPNRSVKVRPEDEDYFNDLNEKKWIKAIQEYVLEGEDATCPKCKQEATVE